MRKLIRFLFMLPIVPLSVLWIALWVLFAWLDDDDLSELKPHIKQTRFYQWLTFK